MGHKNGGLGGNGGLNLRYWFCDPEKALPCAEPRRLTSAGLMPTEARANYLPEAPYLRETKTYLCDTRQWHEWHSQPLESTRHAGNYFVPISIRPISIFCCRSYVKWRAEKNFCTSGGPLRPEARGICHMINPALRLTYFASKSLRASRR